MENNIYHLSTGVKNITVVGLPEGANHLSVSDQNGLWWRDNTKLKWGAECPVTLPPGSYTLIGTLNEMSEEQAAEIVQYIPLGDGGKEWLNYMQGPARFNTALESLRSLLSFHGLLNKYPNVAILEKIK